MNAGNVPPQNLEAEDSVLGACLIAPGAIDACSDILHPDDFYKPSNGAIYRAILALHSKGEPVDAVTLSAALPDEKVRVYALAGAAISSANASHYARIVREAAQRRALIKAGGEITQLGWEHGEDSPALIERAEGKVYALAQARERQQVDLPRTVKQVYDDLVAQDGKPTRELLGAPSGLPDLDRVTRGFRAGDLIVVAAGTGRGKSALWLNMALHNLHLGRPVAAFSLEMSEAELINRALSLESGIPHDRVTRGEIKPDEWGKLTTACEFLVDAPLSLWTDAEKRPAGIRSDLRRWRARNPDASLAVVDYLQLVTPDEKSDNRTVDVSAISRSLKVTAMTLGVPVLAVSQLHRIEPNVRPHKGNLRESGAIENDASVVILVHRTDSEPGTAELICDKNRHGATDTVKVKWDGPHMRFSSLVHEARAA